MRLSDNRVRLTIFILVAVIAVVGFRVAANIMARNEQAEKSSRGKVAVVTADYPKRQTIVPKFRFSGTMDPVWQADVAAKVDGRIEQVLVSEGEAVSAGQALVVLEQTDTEALRRNALGALIDARTNLEKASRDRLRFEELYKEGAISREQVENARFALQNAEARLDAAQGTLDAAESRAFGTVVTTPRAGIIQKRYYQEGYYAKVGTALFNIADISTLLVKIAVPEGYIASVAVGGTVTFQIPSMSGSDKTAVGAITRVSPVATMPARTFEAEVSVDNKSGRLRGGVYANAVITAQPKENALTVPLSAIAMRDDQRTVYVIEDGVAVRRVLATGYIGENIVEVLDGVTENDQIITGGLNKVREGAKVRVAASPEEAAKHD
ncbi:MAG: efflux RND transporter periplasmic adaptor subunit [Schwartzia sp.]|nr:efflux RND transporter periplasmic adaptor subunit [Schwartzia sp. (in: firmicutes)]